MRTPPSWLQPGLAQLMDNALVLCTPGRAVEAPSARAAGVGEGLAGANHGDVCGLDSLELDEVVVAVGEGEPVRAGHVDWVLTPALAVAGIPLLRDHLLISVVFPRGPNSRSPQGRPQGCRKDTLEEVVGQPGARTARRVEGVESGGVAEKGGHPGKTAGLRVNDHRVRRKRAAGRDIGV
jgi:hypothetical protein